MMVSVIMITYGHAGYIRQAIEGVLNQECTFPIELIIANDASPDNTDEVVAELLSSHPNASRVKYTRHANNLGMQPNYIWAANQASGKYIASCEGDDFWTDPLKLQKQVDFLEANPGFELCFHSIMELRNGVTTVSPLDGKTDATFDLTDLASRNFIHTPSVVYRRLSEGFPAWFAKVPAGDYPLYILLARKGRIRYIAEPMAVYRLHDTGIWSTQSRVRVLKRWHETLTYILTLDFEPEIRSLLAEQARRTVSELLMILQRTGEEEAFLEQLGEYTAADPELAKDWLLVHFPAQIREIKQSGSYRLATTFSKLGGRMFGWLRPAARSR